MTENAARPVVHLTLDENAVSAPAHAAAAQCRELIDFCFEAITKADLTSPPSGVQNSFFRFNIKGPELDASARRNLYENWILARAFQDLTRGIRSSLEEAYLFIEIISLERHEVKSSSTLEEFLAPFREQAGKKNFPDLLESVNSRLSKPLDFIDAFRSMQATRNCLEHRNGIVGQADTGGKDSLTLRFPRMVPYYERDGAQIEIVPGETIGAGNNQSHVTVMMRYDLRSRNFQLGERLAFTARDFEEIALACYFFGSQLASRLPKLRGNAG